MFVVFSKVFWLLAQPSSILVLTLAMGIALSFRPKYMRLGRRIAALGIVLLLLAGLSPLSTLVLLPLENRIARTWLKPGEPIDGIVILGGMEDGRVSRARGSLAINEAAERLTDALLLARRLPETRVVFSGGVAAVLFDEAPGAGNVVDFLAQAGVTRDRLVAEGRSKNTYQNALFTKRLVKPKPGERWLLVTSAYHMSRALGCFRKVGFEVMPWPVDYRTKDANDLLRPFGSVVSGLRRLDLATREWVGLVAYYASGRTSALFPR